MKRRLAAVAALWGMASACAWTQPYDRQVVREGELVYVAPCQRNVQCVFDDDGQAIVRGMGLNGLVEATRCVPQAQAYAVRARGAARNSWILLWSSIAALAVGFTGGTIVAVTSEDDSLDATAIPFLAVIGLGAVGLFGYSSYQSQAEARVLDSVNAYNALYPSVAACRSSTVTSAAP